MSTVFHPTTIFILATSALQFFSSQPRTSSHACPSPLSGCGQGHFGPTKAYGRWNDAVDSLMVNIILAKRSTTTTITRNKHAVGNQVVRLLQTLSPQAPLTFLNPTKRPLYGPPATMNYHHHDDYLTVTTAATAFDNDTTTTTPNDATTTLADDVTTRTRTPALTTTRKPLLR